MIISLLAYSISSILFEDLEEEISEWLLLTIFISVLAVMIFIYFFEDYLSSIKRNHKLAL